MKACQGISLVVPCYNGASYLCETLDSVLVQSSVPRDIIVVDDGSTDGSWGIIESYGDTVRGIQTEHRGGAHARNRGAAAAAGDALMFLDADDLIAPDTLAALSAALARTPDGLAYCDWRFLREADGGWREEASDFPLAPPKGNPLAGWLTGWFIPTCSVLWSRAAFTRVGGWDEELTANQDGDIMMRALVAGGDLVPAQGGMSYYRRYARSAAAVSRNYSAEALSSRYRVLAKVEAGLTGNGRLRRYRQPLGRAYCGLSRLCAANDAPDLAGTCREQAEEHFARAGLLTRALTRLGGTAAVEGFIRQRRRVCRKLSRLSGRPLYCRGAPTGG